MPPSLYDRVMDELEQVDELTPEEESKILGEMIGLKHGRVVISQEVDRIVGQHCCRCAKSGKAEVATSIILGGTFCTKHAQEFAGELDQAQKKALKHHRRRGSAGAAGGAMIIPGNRR